MERKIGTIYNAEQDRPIQLYNKKIKFKNNLNRVKKYLEIIRSHHKYIDVEKLLSELKNGGCSYAYVTNVILHTFIKDNDGYDDLKFKELFGFSLELEGTSSIDANTLMVDIFSSLYNVRKLNIHKYDVRCYDNEEEAVKDLVGRNLESGRDSVLAIIDSGYNLHGVSDDGKLRYISRNPINSTIVGTKEEIVKSLFNIEKESISDDEFKELFDSRSMTFNQYDITPYSKFSGTESSHINYWVNYYFQKNNIDMYFECKKVSVDNDIKTFSIRLNNLVDEGYVIGVDCSPNSGIEIYDPILNQYIPISTKKVGHIMTFMGIESNGDMLVESWGREFIVENKNIGKMFFSASRVGQNNNVNSNKKSDDVIKK